MDQPKQKYFPEGKTCRFQGKNYANNWVLYGKTPINGDKVKENFLPKMVWVNSQQYVKIKGKALPYDGNYLYCSQRTEKYSGSNHKISKLIQIQKGWFSICGASFMLMDYIEVDPILQRKKGGSNRYENLQALHKHSHIQKSRLKNSVSINK